HGGAGAGVEFEVGGGGEGQLGGMRGVVPDPGVAQAAQRPEEVAVPGKGRDLRLEVGPDAPRDDVGQVGAQVALVGEVLEQAALADAGLPGDHVEAAPGEALGAELGLGGGGDGVPPGGGETIPGRRGHVRSLGYDHWSYDHW